MNKVKETFSGAPKGSRKQSVSTTSMLFLLAGLAMVAWMKADVQLFIAYVVGVGGTNFSFMWSNSREHAANTLNPQSTTTTSSSSSSSETKN